MIVKNSLVTAMEFSRCARTLVRPVERPAVTPVSQNSTAFVEVDVVLGELGNRTAEAIDWPSAYRK